MYISRLSEQLISELDKKNIRYCHWKSNEHLLEGLNGITDLDILVNKEDKNLFWKILNELWFKKVISQPYQTYVGVEDWLGFCEKTGVMLHLHIHYELVTGTKYVKEFMLPWNKYVLDNICIDEVSKMKIINPNIELIILLIRISIKAKFRTILKSKILKNNAYSNDIEKELEYLFKRIDKEYINKNLKEMFSEESVLALKLEEIIIKEKLTVNDILKLKRLIKKELKESKKYNDLEIVLKYLSICIKIKLGAVKERLGFNIIRRKRFETGGCAITFVGCDGAGKTTMIEDTYKWIKWKIDVHELYLGSGDNVKNPILKNLNKFIRKTSKSKKKEKEKEKITKIKSNFSVKLFLKSMLFMYIAKDKKRNVHKLIKLKQLGSIVITDRYPQIQFVGINDGPCIRSHVVKYNSNKYFEKLALREERIYKDMVRVSPDIVIKLIVKPDIAIKRKPEHTYEQLEKKVEIISKLDFVNSKVYEVDASQSIEKVSLDIRKIIWENIK